MGQISVIDELKQLKPELQRKYPIVRLGLFGSFARGTESETSDIDVVVELKSRDMFDLIGIKQEIEARLYRKVDLIRLRDRMNPSLKQRIEKQARYV